MSGRNWLRTLLADSTILFAIWGETRTEYLGSDRQGHFYSFILSVQNFTTDLWPDRALAPKD